MSTLLVEFHWLRPGWLLLLPLLPLLLWVRRGAGAADAWREHCDATLLDYLGESSPFRSNRWPLMLLLLGWLLGVMALAGPAWERVESQVFRSAVSQVVVLDLSRSMDATDVVPTRLTRARFKVADLLARAAGGRVGLVVFAGDAFALAPLTDDVNTLLNLLPTLETSLMPVQGSHADLGLARAVELLQNGGATGGQILLVTDGAPAEAEAAARAARAAGHRVAVLMVGTRAGAPIPDAGGGFLKDSQGRIVVPGVDTARLLAIANAGGGRAATLSADDSDIDRLLLDPLDRGLRDASSEQQRTAGQRWLDRGPWLLLALLPLAALAFRRGWLLCIGLVAGLSPPTPVSALQWSDLWQRPEQRVHQALQADDTETALNAAAEAAPAWRGSAFYRAGDYTAAADAFGADASAVAHYNRGNALAHAGRLAEALEAYDRALAEQPDLEDASFNRTLVEKMLQDRQEQEQQNQQGGGESDPEPGSDEARQNQADTDDKGSGETGDPSQKAPDASVGDAGDKPSGTSGPPKTGEGETPAGDAPSGSAAHDNAQDAAAASEANGSPEDPEAANGAATRAERAPLDDATASRIEQMLRRVPDDPGGLLRRKFALEHARRSRGQVVVEQAW